MALEGGGFIFFGLGFGETFGYFCDPYFVGYLGNHGFGVCFRGL